MVLTLNVCISVKSSQMSEGQGSCAGASEPGDVSPRNSKRGLQTWLWRRSKGVSNGSQQILSLVIGTNAAQRRDCLLLSKKTVPRNFEHLVLGQACHPSPGFATMRWCELIFRTRQSGCYLLTSFKEREQVGIDLVRVGCGHPMGKAGIHL